MLPLVLYDGPRSFISRILAVDNGSSHVGLSVLDHDIRRHETAVIWQTNFDAGRIVEDRSPGKILLRGEYQARLEVIASFFDDVLEEFDPDVVGCESPFQHLNAKTYASLITSMNVFDNACYRFRPNLPFVKVPPGKGKKAACPPGQYKDDKEWIAHCLKTDPRIHWANGINPDLMGPDALDSVAVGRYIASLEDLEEDRPLM